MPSISSTTISAQNLFAQAKINLANSGDEAIKIAEKARKIAIDEEDSELLFEILCFLGKNNYIKGNAFEGLSYLNEAYRCVNKYFTHDNVRLSIIYKEYGSLYTNCFQEYATALSYTLKSLACNNDDLATALHNNIGCQYTYLKKYDKALHYLNIGRKLSIERGEEYILCFIYENFGVLYFEQGDFEQSIYNFKQGLESTQKVGPNFKNKALISYIKAAILLGMVKTYLSSGELSSIPGLIKKQMLSQRKLTFKVLKR